MRKNIVVITIFITSFSTAFGGLFDSTNVHLPHSGSMSLDFGLSGLFNFSHYIGNTISYKSFSSPHRSQRFSLYTSMDGYDLAGDGQAYKFTSSSSTLDSTKIDHASRSKFLDISLTIQWIRYSEPYGNLSLLYGIGPTFGYEARERENNQNPLGQIFSGYYQQTKDITRVVYAGLAPVIGIEWYLHKNFSFHAEYYTMINIGWQTSEGGNRYENGWGDWEESEFKMEGLYHSIHGRAQAGVSFYFR